MATDLQTKITNFKTELNDIITDLKTKADAGTGWTGSEQTDMKKRIDHITLKTNTHHSNLTNPLEFDLTDLNGLLSVIGADKTQWAAEKVKLEGDKLKAETAKNNKEKELIKVKTEIVDKLNADLISGLDKVAKIGLQKPKKDKEGNEVKDANGNIIYEELIDTTKIEAIKTVVEELKTKGISADFSKLDTKFADIKNKIEANKPTGEQGGKESNTTKYWAMGACILGGLALLGIIFLFFTRSKKEEYPTASE